MHEAEGPLEETAEWYWEKRGGWIIVWALEWLSALLLSWIAKRRSRLPGRR